MLFVLNYFEKKKETKCIRQEKQDFWLPLEMPEFKSGPRCGFHIHTGDFGRNLKFLKP